MTGDARPTTDTPQWDDMIDVHIWYANLVQQRLNPHKAGQTWLDAFDGSYHSHKAKFDMMKRNK